MTDSDYAELRARLMAHQILLCASLATHPNKGQFSASLAQALDQMKSLLLASRLDDQTLAVFDKEIQAILKKAGIEQEDGRKPPQ